MRALRRERVQAALGAPGEEDAQVGLGVGPGQPLVSGEIAGHGAAEHLRAIDRDCQGHQFQGSCHDPNVHLTGE